MYMQDNSIKSKTRTAESKYKRFRNCLKCNKVLEKGKGWKYCSKRCCKLFLKAEYKKRNRAKINQYNSDHAKRAETPYAPSPTTKRIVKEKMSECQRCLGKFQLELAHIKPHWAKGSNKPHNFIVFCKKCHYEYDELTRNFW